MDRKAHLRLKYRISLDDYDTLLAAQVGVCPGCQRTAEEAGMSWFYVDHDHACCPGMTTCGRCVRGLLCDWCNRGLGLLMDNPGACRRLADYLEDTPAKVLSDRVMIKQHLRMPRISEETRRARLLSALAIEPLSGSKIRDVVGGSSDKVLASLNGLAADGFIVRVGALNHPLTRWTLA